ncbi:MAG TPA: response regulator [Bryobacteraceae bacterium]|nr:response regulator [Bryobacteraceae bacterium]
MPRRILVVDDELYVTQLLSFILRRAGDEVFTADEGQGACAMAHELVPDLIIADYQMPGINGMEMARQLRADPATAEVPVLVLTARGHRLNPHDVDGTSVRCMLAKPFSPRELLARVEEMIGPGCSTQTKLPGTDAAVA